MKLESEDVTFISIIFIIVILLPVVFLLLGCGSPDCPEEEKIVVRYETRNYANTTTVIPIKECPE